MISFKINGEKPRRKKPVFKEERLRFITISSKWLADHFFERHRRFQRKISFKF